MNRRPHFLGLLAGLFGSVDQAFFTTDVASARRPVAALLLLK